MKILRLGGALGLLLLGVPWARADEPLSTQFHVTAGSAELPVYLARVCNLPAEQRIRLHEEIEAQTDQTSFASFDLSRPIQVSVSCAEPVRSVKVLPSSRGIVPAVAGSRVTFTVTRPGALVVEINGDWVRSLQLFANPPETDAPRPDDPNVIYFGPGTHEVKSLEVTSGQTVYLAPGAVVYGSGSAGNGGGAVFELKGSNITVRGRGILDGSRCSLHTRSLLGVYGSNIRVEGIVLRDSSIWNVPVRRCDHVTIENVKIFGWRANSDGIDICNSRDVEVRDCFLRTFDDLVVLKTDQGQGDLYNVTVERCVLWNEFAHALSLGAELREPLGNVLFSDCDIVHDKGREWLLRVYNCDSAWVRNVAFANIRVEEARRLCSVWIGHAGWSKEGERGHAENVSFQDITSAVPEREDPWVDLVGFDAGHAVDNVTFRNVRVGGRPLNTGDVRQNRFVNNVRVQP